MQKLLRVVFIVCTSLLSIDSVFAGHVLIYKGAGSCTDGCAAAAAEIPAVMGYDIKLISNREFSEDLFKDAVLWIQPGGNAIKAAKAMGPERLQVLRNWIGRGGAYVGFCAGAFLADTTVDDDGKVPGLGIIPFTTDYLNVDSNFPWGTMIDVVWNSVKRRVFFNGGSTFDLTSSKDPVNVIARFAPNGEAATILYKYKRGTVVVTGAHPEATDAWKREGGLRDDDGPDYDLAKDMIARALAK